MNSVGSVLRGGLAVCLALAAVTACRKPRETAKSDLSEAGYRLTAEDWLRAAGNNDVAAMKKFVASGFPLESRDANGDSALHAAAAAGARDSADFLLDRGLPVDIRGKSERTPLMAAISANQPAMVAWLLRQGADPQMKDSEGFKPLMLAVKVGQPGALEELAPRDRDNLDSALLLAALMGQTEAIDTLTKYGASVYARMNDGRTPLMLAAENGHTDSVKLLLDLGSSRFSSDSEGQTAFDLARTAGHPEIADLIARDPLPGELRLETQEEIAQSMDAFVDAKSADSSEEEAIADADTDSTSPTQDGPSPRPSQPIDGAVLSAVKPVATSDQPDQSPESSAPFEMPPLVMRHYRQREIPIEIRRAEANAVTVTLHGAAPREATVKVGETIPNSRLVVVGVKRRMESSKLNLGQPMEVSVIEVRDTATGMTRDWISGVPATGHDPVALVEDAATGQRYIAAPGQRFKSEDGGEFIVSDVRPNQLIIEDAASGAVQTIPLRGPRG